MTQANDPSAYHSHEPAGLYTVPLAQMTSFPIKGLSLSAALATTQNHVIRVHVMALRGEVVFPVPRYVFLVAPRWCMRCKFSPNSDMLYVRRGLTDSRFDYLLFCVSFPKPCFSVVGYNHCACHPNSTARAMQYRRRHLQ